MSQPTHGELLLEQLRQQRNIDFLCDITITLGNVPFRAHRNVLAAFSQFFSCVCDGAQQDMTLDPDLVSEQALESLLEFVYTGEMSVDSESSEVVRRAAIFLGMTAAEDYMDNVLHLSRPEEVNESEARIECEPTVPFLPASPSPLAPPTPRDSPPSVSLPGDDAERDEEMGEGEGEENVDDPDFVPATPITPSAPQRGQGRKIRPPKKYSPDDSATISSDPDDGDDRDDIANQRGRGRGSRRGRGRGRVMLKSEELSFVDSDLRAIKRGRNVPSDLDPSSPSSPAKRSRGRSGEGKVRGRGRNKLKENRPSDGEGDEEEGGGKLTKQQPVCKECNKKFSEDSSLRRHMRIHRGIKPFLCPICSKQFRQGNQLKTHMRIHTGEKPFACTQCDKSFVQKCQLVSHGRMYHGEEKPYRCEQCGLQFATSSNFKIHCRLHSGERPYVCEDCGKAFAQISTLIYHRRRHTGEKPYQCDTCGMSFSVSSSLITHSRKHKGEPQFPCSQCDKRYITASERNKHMRTHSKVGIVPCEFCGNTFVSIKNMLRHLERAHADRQPTAVSEGSSGTTSHHHIPIDHQGLISRLVPGSEPHDPDMPELIKREPSPPSVNADLPSINLVIPKAEPDMESHPELAGMNPDTLRALVEQLQASSPADGLEQIIIIQTQ